VSEEIVARIARAAGVPELAEVLAERLTPTDLQSLLLEVYRRRAAALTPSDLARRYEASRFVAPSPLDPAALLELDRLAFSLLPSGYEALELSPVAPLGTSAVLGGLSQDWAVSTSRNTEVLSDSTNVLALECARRRRADGASRVKLAAAHRVLRGQRYDDPLLRPHFRLFGLCAAGRNTGSWQFEADELAEQLDFHLRLLAAAGVEAPRAAVTPLAEGIEERVLLPLAERLPVVIDRNRERGRGYYVGACFAIFETRSTSSTAASSRGRRSSSATTRSAS